SSPAPDPRLIRLLAWGRGTPGPGQARRVLAPRDRNRRSPAPATPRTQNAVPRTIARGGSCDIMTATDPSPRIGSSGTPRMAPATANGRGSAGRVWRKTTTVPLTARNTTYTGKYVTAGRPANSGPAATPPTSPSPAKAAAASVPATIARTGARRRRWRTAKAGGIAPALAI